jgi:hypothetical protein
MLIENLLPKKLIKAREKRRLSIWQASQRMNGVYPNTLRTLEGLNPDRDPAGERCELKTVMEIIRVYWPDVTLEDFTGSPLQMRLVPKDAKSERLLKGYLAKTG